MPSISMTPDRHAEIFGPYDEYMSGPKSGRFRKCRVCGDLHDVSNWPDNHRDEPPERSDLAAPTVIRDEIGGINGVECPTNGRRVDSKRALRKEYTRAGVYEIGNEKIKPRDRGPCAKDIAKDVKASIDILSCGESSTKDRLTKGPAPVAGGFSTQ